MRARALARALAKALGLAIVLVIALALGVAIHVNLPASRRVAVVETNRLLLPLFHGEVHIDRIGALSLGGVKGAHVRIDDPAASRVVEADGVDARIETWKLVRSLAARSGPIDVHVYDASAERIRVSLAADDGNLKIAKAIALKPKAAPAPAPPRAVRFALDVVSVGVHVYDAPRDLALTGDLRGHLDVASGVVRASGSLAGDVSAVPIAVAAALDGDRVDATLKLGKVDAAKLTAFLPELALRGVASAHAELHGTLARLAFALGVALDDATLDARGEIVRGDELRVTGDADVARVDVAAIVAGAPPTSLDAKIAARLTRKPDGALDADATATVPAGTVNGAVIPAATLVVKLDDTRARGTLAVDEPGARADATFEATRVDRKLAFDVTTDAPDLAKIARLGGYARGRVAAHAKGTILFDTKQIDAVVDADAWNVATGPLAIGRARVDARVHGPIADPSAEGKLTVTGVVASGLAVSRGVLRVAGPARRPRLTVEGDGPSATHFEAGAEVALALPIDVRHAFARLRRNGAEISARVAEVRVDGTEVRVTGAIVEGLGDPARIDVDKRASSLRLRVAAPRLRLARLAAFSRAPVPIGGRLDLDADVTITAGLAHGKIKLDARRVHVKEVRNVSAQVDATFDGRRVSGDVALAIPGVVTVRAAAPDVTLGGDVTHATSWVGAKGHGEIAAELVLDRVVALLPAGTVPLTELSGALGVSATVDRRAHDVEPTITFAASTHGLVAATEKWRASGVDADVGGHLEGRDGAIDLTATLHDAVGPLASVSANAKVGDLRAKHFDEVPFRARVALAPRDAQALPPPARPAGVRGVVDALVVVEGPLVRPRVGVLAHARRFVVDASDVDPADVVLSGSYDGEHAQLDAVVSGQHGQTVHALADVTVLVADLLHAQHVDAIPWRGSAHASLRGLKLQSIPAAADHRVSGDVTGELQVDDFHADARARLSLDVANLGVGRVRRAKASVLAVLESGAVGVIGTLDHGDGSARIDARAAMHWGAALRPFLDPLRSAQLALRTSTLRVALFAPFAGDSFRDIDGRVTADLNGAVGPIGVAPSFAGTVDLKDGTVNVPAVGQDLQDVTAHVALTRDGDLTIDRASARASSGTVSMSGRAKLDGGRLSRAEATLQVAEAAPIPVTVGGEPLGEVWGRVDVKAVATAAMLTADVDVPSLHVRLPDVARSAAQSLAPAKDVHVGVRLRDGSLAPIVDSSAPATTPGVGKPVRVRVKFGEDVEVRHGTMLRVGLRGGPTIDLAETMNVSGQIRLVNGTLDVEGKRFLFEEGTVSFVGDDPTNPTLAVTATWDAGDGTRVYADYIGPLKTGKLTLRSEPALSQNEILALILFGTTDGLQGQGGMQAGVPNAAIGAGAGVGAGIATEGVNKAISQLTTIDVATRVDTAHETPRPEIVIQLTRNISAQFAYVLGTPPVGQNLDQTLLTVNWRFLGKWSLETTVGDAGSSIVDVLWKHRY